MKIHNEYSDTLHTYTDRFIQGLLHAGHNARLIGDAAILADNKYVFSVSISSEDFAEVKPATKTYINEHLAFLNKLTTENPSCFEPVYIFRDGYPVEPSMTSEEKEAFVVQCLGKLGHRVDERPEGLWVDGRAYFSLTVFNDKVTLQPAGQICLAHRRVYRNLNILR